VIQENVVSATFQRKMAILGAEYANLGMLFELAGLFALM
jgi:hypothetical protein